MATILVIEDEDIILDNLLEILELEGFQSIGAEHGAAGIAKAKAYRPDIILCDIRMPELDGYGVLEGLRQDPDTATIPVIFLSAKGDRSDVRRGMNLGADDYLTKPCAIADLLEAIQSRLKKKAVLLQTYSQSSHSFLQSIAHTDSLTNLPSRFLLHQHLQRAMEQSNQEQSNQEQSIAVLCVNVNRFRTINATYGHGIGDELLQTIGQRLQKTVQSASLIARMGADEFGVVLTSVLDQQAVADVAQLILTAVTSLYSLKGHEIRVQVSIGVALHSRHAKSSEELVLRAETARRWCQKQGQSSYMFYNLTMDAVEAERRLIESDLGKALEQSEFQLYYQPQVNLMTGQIVGVESLIRWCHPQRGMIPPNAFIPVAEEMGLIIPIGEWVLRTACLQAQQWQQMSLQPLQVSVNLSMRQFQQADLAQRVAQILQETGLAPELLVLELTETCLMKDVNSTIKTLRSLKKIGVEISIDDFGTGYSSLNYLNHLPIDTLKMDQTFVREATVNRGAAAISTAIMAMAQSLKLEVIAEGVETHKQLLFLREIGCQAMQGFLYSPPLPADELQPLLRTDRRLQMISACSKG
ncbi:putative bifunctional diguanylate cyclase/phosphodiesterase [Phormidesmis sp. 146-12]